MRNPHFTSYQVLHSMYENRWTHEYFSIMPSDHMMPETSTC